MATITDVAKEAGVSVSTVSFVLNKKDVVADHTRERVLEAIDRLNYVPNHVARALRDKSSLYADFVGVAVPAESMWLHQIIHGIEKSLHKTGNHLLLGMIHRNTDGGYSFPKMFEEKQVDRIILVSSVTWDNIDLIRKVKDFGIPVLVIDYPASEFNLPSIMVDSQRGVYEACLHLIGQGYKTLATITGPMSYAPAGYRYDGFRLALMENNLALDENLVCEGDFGEAGGYEGMKKIMEKAEFPLGLFAANDAMAKGALRFLKEQNIDVPGDVGIVGFDDIPDFALASDPALSSVRPHWHMIGEEAVRQVKTLKAAYNGNAWNIVMPCELVVRGSSLRNPAPGKEG